MLKFCHFGLKMGPLRFWNLTELDSFLVLAEELQLKGLEGNSEETFQEHQTESFDYTGRGAEAIQRPNMPERTISDVKFEHGASLFKGKAMMAYQQRTNLNSLIKPSTMEKIEYMIEKRVDGYYCINCGLTSKKKDNMREHAEKHIEGLEYPCNSCNKIMRSSHSFRDHKRKNCQFKSSSQD